MNSYFRQTLLICMTSCCLLAGANWLLNPYLMFDSPVVKGLNQLITENYYKQLLFKPYQLRIKKPRSIIIGASQAGVAFNPDKLLPPAYNLAVGGSTSYLQYRLLQEALAINPALDNVILETPFLSFNDDDPNNIPGQDASLENRLSIQQDGRRNLLQPAYAAQEILSSLISWEVTRASWRMVLKQKSIEDKRKGSFIQLRSGQWKQQPSPDNRTLQTFEKSWEKALFNDWLPAPSHTYTLPDSHSGALAFFRKNLQILYSKNINTILVIAPMHASLMIGLQETGLWNTYQQWKQILVSINQEEAQLANRPAFPLYDYAIINAMTSEEIPDTNTTSPMKWFNDSLHPSPQFGDVVLQEILTGHPINGRLLDKDTSDTLMKQDDITLAQYITKHTDVQTAIRQTIQKHSVSVP